MLYKFDDWRSRKKLEIKMKDNSESELKNEIKMKDKNKSNLKKVSWKPIKCSLISAEYKKNHE